MAKYPWYVLKTPSDSILQGDIIPSCPVIIPRNPKERLKDGKRVPADVVEYNIIVLSQSCDLEQYKIDLVLVSPVWTREQMFKHNPQYFRDNKEMEELRKGRLIGYHLLNKCELKGYETDFLIVDFRNIYIVPYLSLEQLAASNSKRLGLQPPYREHLSQAFARFFMRVGLPVDIPPFV